MCVCQLDDGSGGSFLVVWLMIAAHTSAVLALFSLKCLHFAEEGV